MACLNQRRKHTAVVEYVPIHQEHRSARRERLAHRPERQDAALLVVGVVDGGDLRLPERRQRTLDGEGLVADANRHVANAERGENSEVAFQQGAAAEAQQHLGFLDCQAPANAGGKHDGAHGQTSGVVTTSFRAI